MGVNRIILLLNYFFQSYYCLRFVHSCCRAVSLGQLANTITKWRCAILSFVCFDNTNSLFRFLRHLRFQWQKTNIFSLHHIPVLTGGKRLCMYWGLVKISRPLWVETVCRYRTQWKFSMRGDGSIYSTRRYLPPSARNRFSKLFYVLVHFKQTNWVRLRCEVRFRMYFSANLAY